MSVALPWQCSSTSGDREAPSCCPSFSSILGGDRRTQTMGIRLSVLAGSHWHAGERTTICHWAPISPLGPRSEGAWERPGLEASAPKWALEARSWANIGETNAGRMRRNCLWGVSSRPRRPSSRLALCMPPSLHLRSHNPMAEPPPISAQHSERSSFQTSGRSGATPRMGLLRAETPDVSEVDHVCLV